MVFIFTGTQLHLEFFFENAYVFYVRQYFRVVLDLRFNFARFIFFLICNILILLLQSGAKKNKTGARCLKKFPLSFFCCAHFLRFFTAHSEIQAKAKIVLFSPHPLALGVL